jgi:hypothetical protein
MHFIPVSRLFDTEILELLERMLEKVGGMGEKGE